MYFAVRIIQNASQDVAM